MLFYGIRSFESAALVGIPLESNPPSTNIPNKGIIPLRATHTHLGRYHNYDFDPSTPPDWLRFLCFLCLLSREIVIVAYYGKGNFTIAVSDGAQCLCFDLGSSQSQARERNHLSRMGGAEPDRYGNLLQQRLMGIVEGAI